MKPTSSEIETFEYYKKEYEELRKKFLKNPNLNWEEKHRMKILYEWMEDQLKQWNIRD